MHVYLEESCRASAEVHASIIELIVESILDHLGLLLGTAACFLASPFPLTKEMRKLTT